MLHLILGMLEIIDLFKDLPLRSLGHLVDMGLEMLVLSLVLLDEVIDRVLQLVVLLVKLHSQVLDVAGSDASHLVDGTFPVFASIALVIVGFGHKQVDVLLLCARGLLKTCDQVTHELEFGLGGIDFLVLHDSLKSVAHDGDQHVKHGNLGDKRRRNEEEEAHKSLGLVGKVVHVKLSQGKHVLVQ